MRSNRFLAFAACLICLVAVAPIAAGQTFNQAYGSAGIPSSNPTANATARLHLPLVFKDYPPPVPDAPTLLPIGNSDHDGGYTVQWTQPQFADGYELQESVDGGDWITVYTGPDASRDFAGQSPATYSYRVLAENVRGQSPWSNQASVVVPPPPIPEAPTLLSIDNSDNDGDYTVQWTQSQFADGYELQESVDGGDWTTAYTGPDASRDFVGQSPATYSYRVRAENAQGQSLWSNQESVVVPPPPDCAARSGQWVGDDRFEGSFTVAPDCTVQNLAGTFWTPFCGRIDVPGDLEPPASIPIVDGAIDVLMHIPDTIDFLDIDGAFTTETSVEGDYAWGVEGCGLGGRIDWSASWQGD